MKFSVITVFPKLIEDYVQQGLLGQALRSGLAQVSTLNPRDFAQDTHRTVDDRSFGGSDGMVMKVEPLVKALDSIGGKKRVFVLSPQGRTWNQEWASSFVASQATDESIVLVCGRYAGIDHRFIVEHAEDEISLGDFVLNGGELAACAVLESIIRLIPGTVGNEISTARDSFSSPEGWLECPQFTRPREVEGLPVPSPLLSGHHAKIAEFERAVSFIRTLLLRPDLIQDKAPLSQAKRLVLELDDVELKVLGLNRLEIQRLGLEQ